jgi:glycosyltransferase domain-containing protein
MIEVDLSEVTLILPTYNRPYFAKRAISYWSSTNIQVVVLDGSKTSFQKNEVDALPDNVRYVHSETSLTERILLGSKMTNTKFAALTFDDEFYLPESIAEFVQELENETSLVSIMGNVAGFTSSSGKYFFQHIYPEINGYKVDQENSQDRVMNHLSPYRMTSLTAVIRTEVFLKNALVANSCSKMPYATMFEIGFEIANVFQGKSRTDSILYWLRSSENPPSWQAPREQIWTWWDSYKHSAEALEICIEVEEILNSWPAKGFPTPEETILFKGLNAYSEGIRTNRDVSVKKSVFAKLRSHLRNFFRDDQIYEVKNFLKRFLGNRHVRAFWVGFSELETALQSKGIRVPQISGNKLLVFLEQYPRHIDL